MIFVITRELLNHACEMRAFNTSWEAIQYMNTLRDGIAITVIRGEYLLARKVQKVTYEFPSMTDDD